MDFDSIRVRARESISHAAWSSGWPIQIWNVPSIHDPVGMEGSSRTCPTSARASENVMNSILGLNCSSLLSNIFRNSTPESWKYSQAFSPSRMTGITYSLLEEPELPDESRSYIRLIL